MVMTQIEADRFWMKVRKTDTCWKWTAATNGFGYGKLTVRQRTRYAHRLSYEMAHGPIPDGMLIDHICRNPGCVNPAHLRLATKKQNAENLALSTRNTSGVRGVSSDRQRGKWLALVMHEQKHYYCGIFDDIRDAEAAVVAKRNELFTHNDADRAPW